MHKSKHRFATNKNAEFFRELRNGVNSYFKENNLPKQGNNSLLIKSVLMILLFLVPYLILITAGISSSLIVLLLWVLMALGMSGIGLNIMHDANHGSFSKNGKLNKLMMYSLNMIGGSAYIWRLQHNVMHHTYTNIDGADDDINVHGIFRFSPVQKPLGIHKLQFVYAWFVYCFMSLSFVATKDFIHMYKFKSHGLIKPGKEFRSEMTKLVISKILYYCLVLILPILVVPVPAYVMVIGFLVMHFISGFILSVIFQTAHVMPDCEFPEPDTTGLIDENWAVHQMLTTTNYAPKSKLFTWLIGGLNYQVEHHLFSNISHVHYKNISKIVRATAEKYGVPYNMEPSFMKALWKHGRMLYELGRPRLRPVPVKN